MQDVISLGGPDEGLGAFIVDFDVGLDDADELRYTGEDPAA